MNQRAARAVLALVIGLGTTEVIPATASAYELAAGVDRARYNRAGVAINATNHTFAKAMADDDAVRAASCFHPDFAAFSTPPRLMPGPDLLGIRFAPWRGRALSADSAAGTIEWFRSWRAEMATVDRWVLKLVALERVDKQGATATLRFEVIADRPNFGAAANERATWRGRMRARFVWHDKRLVFKSLRILEGRTSAGARAALADDAVARGIDFFGAPDARFLPPSDKLKFQTSRHSIGGVSAADFDGDGDDDLMFFAGGRATLYRNDGKGRFTDATREAGCTCSTGRRTGIRATASATRSSASSCSAPSSLSRPWTRMEVRGTTVHGTAFRR